MVDIFLLAQKLNPVLILNRILPAGMGEVVVLLWCIIGLIAVFLLFGVLKTGGKFFWNMYLAKRQNLTMGVIPLMGKTTSVLLSKEDKEQRKYKFGDFEWILSEGTGDTWDNGVRYTMLVPGLGTSININQLMNAFREKEEFSDMPTAADIEAEKYTLACMEAEAMKSGGDDSFKKYMPWIIVLLVVMGGGYFILQGMPPSSVKCVYDIAAATTTTLPSISHIGAIVP